HAGPGDQPGGPREPRAVVGHSHHAAAVARRRAAADAAAAYARLGRVERARALLARYEAEVTDTAFKRENEPAVRNVLGEIALAEKRPLDAVAEFRRDDVAPDGPATSCDACLSAELARAFDATG